MGITVTPRHFSGREEAVAAIAADGLFLAEIDLPPNQFAPAPHSHHYCSEIYLLEGVLELQESSTGRTYRLEPGSKAVVPAGALHLERSPVQSRAAIGLSDDPKTFAAEASGSIAAG